MAATEVDELNLAVLEVLARLAGAVSELFQNKDLIYAAPGERAIVAELHVILRKRFPKHTVNNEYDRHEQATKRLAYPDRDGNLEDAPITPDLVVHHVGIQAHNLLVVEAKRSTNTEYAKDIWKLRGMTDRNGQYRYIVGVHLALDIEASRVTRSDVYIDATVDPGLTQWLAGQF